MNSLFIGLFVIWVAAVLIFANWRHQRIGRSVESAPTMVHDLPTSAFVGITGFFFLVLLIWLY